MSFYINDFKQHLQSIAQKVDQPYDEPASRMKMQESRSIGDVYSSMPKRPIPRHLMEQVTNLRG